MRAKKPRFRPLFCLMAVMLCLTAFTVPAFAGDDSWCEYGDYGTENTDTAASPFEAETQKPTPAPESQKPTSAPTQEQTATPSENGTTATESKPPENTNTTPEPSTSASPDANQKGHEAIDPSGDGEVGKGKPLTPDGNLNLVDDVFQTDSGTDKSDGEPEEKQFIIVQSKNGNYFYIVIDRSGDKENVHFLNQVDEADLMALIEDGKVESEPLVCTCTDKCVPGNINTSCPVCQVAMSECLGKEPEPEPTDEPDTEPEPEKDTKTGNAGLMVIVLVVALVGGGAVYYFKFRKPKPDTKGPVDLDDYDFGDEDDENYEYEKDDGEEPEERNEGD